MFAVITRILSCICVLYTIRYQRQFKPIHLCRPSKPRYSRDQGFYEAEDEDETASVASVPVSLRPKYSRKTRRVNFSFHNPMIANQCT